ncbi:hypothetical protein [Streptosporangium pseudovulgare]|uniref:hypothetical protein n=1 Tax=Streptosporangium pseudovulgare TaxID=35765 RepID=UPI0016705FDE|nr:hypothetical protein [Streptosporangium pseudovulgare]
MEKYPLIKVFMASGVTALTVAAYLATAYSGGYYWYPGRPITLALVGLGFVFSAGVLVMIERKDR